MPIAFVTGGVFSALSGYFGMKIATAANARTANAAHHSLNKGSQDGEDNYQNNEYNSYALVLSFQVSVCTGTDFLGQGLHQVSALVLFHDLLCLKNSKEQSQDCSNRSEDG